MKTTAEIEKEFDELPSVHAMSAIGYNRPVEEIKSFLLSTLDERMESVRSIVPEEEETRLDKLPKDIDVVDIGQRHGWNACRGQFLSQLNSITKGSKED